MDKKWQIEAEVKGQSQIIVVDETVDNSKEILDALNRDDSEAVLNILKERLQTDNVIINKYYTKELPDEIKSSGKPGELSEEDQARLRQGAVASIGSMGAMGMDPSNGAMQYLPAILMYISQDPDSKFSKAVIHSCTDYRILKRIKEASEQRIATDIIMLSMQYLSIKCMIQNWFLTKEENDQIPEHLQEYFKDKKVEVVFDNPISLTYIYITNPSCVLSQAVKANLTEDAPRSFDEMYPLIAAISPEAISEKYNELMGKKKNDDGTVDWNINKYDSTIDNGMFYTKVDNIFVMLYTALMFNDLSRVDHKVSNEVMNKYSQQVKYCVENNQRHMYGQLNVKSSKIDNIAIDEEGNIRVDVTLVARYLNYIIDMNTGNKIDGDDQERIERKYKLQLKKSKDAKELSESRHCPNCGQPADLANTGKCIACNTIFPLDMYDYILEWIEVVK